MSNHLLLQEYFPEYCKIPSLLLREINGYTGLPPRALDLWQDFYELSKYDANRTVKIAINRLVELIGRSRRTIEDYLVKLEKQGFIQRIRNYSEFGSQLASTYKVLVPEHVIKLMREGKKKLSISPDTPVQRYPNDHSQDHPRLPVDINEITAPDEEVVDDILLPFAPPAENCGPYKESGFELYINNNTGKAIDNLDCKSNVDFKNSPAKADELNKWQQAYVLGMLKNVVKAIKMRSQSQFNELFDEVCFSLTSEFQFKGASFKRKVNSIAKLIKLGNWRTPIGFYNHASSGELYKQQLIERENWKDKMSFPTDNLDSIGVILPNFGMSQQKRLTPKEQARQDRVKSLQEMMERANDAFIKSPSDSQWVPDYIQNLKFQMQEVQYAG